jgi:hypothetical protein
MIVAALLGGLLVVTPGLSAIPSASATGYQGYNNDYKSIDKVMSFYKHGDWDDDCEEERGHDDCDDEHDDIKHKLFKLIELDVSCAESRECGHENEDGVALDLGTEVSVDITAKVKDLDIFEKYPKLAKFVIDLLVNDLHVTVTGPSGVVVDEDIDKWLDNKDYDADSDYGQKLRTIKFTVDEPGEYTVDVDFTKFGKVIKTFYCDFLVIPESPVGIAALVMSSLAALGGFAFLRTRKSGSTANL